MTRNVFVTLVFLTMSLSLAGCASREPVAQGAAKYAPTEKVETVFQMNQVPASCRVIAHLFATMPAKMMADAFVGKISDEAQSKGADVLILGQSRQSLDEASLHFQYFGPAREYPVSEWPGWRFGLENWGEQGVWTAIGFDDWQKSDLHFDYPIVIQSVFLRCR